MPCVASMKGSLKKLLRITAGASAAHAQIAATADARTAAENLRLSRTQGLCIVLAPLPFVRRKCVEQRQRMRTRGFAGRQVAGRALCRRERGVGEKTLTCRRVVACADRSAAYRAFHGASRVVRLQQAPAKPIFGPFLLNPRSGELPVTQRTFGGHDHRACLRGIACLLYTSDAADDLLCVDLGGRRIIKK